MAWWWILISNDRLESLSSVRRLNRNICVVRLLRIGGGIRPLRGWLQLPAAALNAVTASIHLVGGKKKVEMMTRLCNSARSVSSGKGAAPFSIYILCSAGRLLHCIVKQAANELAWNMKTINRCYNQENISIFIHSTPTIYYKNIIHREPEK